MLFFYLLLLSQLGHCLHVGKGKAPTADYFPTGRNLHHDTASRETQNHSRFTNAAARASEEILALEGEPVCHTVAARFLSNNCQVLDGKDDATILTDSGRHIRDFLESYAVSLAICDLERGNKTVPDQCIKFRESSLTHIPIHDMAHLHVTSDEIQACLSTFATSAVVWGTYISHKQNALRFCEASLSENNRSQSLKLFQRVTQIMGTLASLFDHDWEQHLSEMFAAVQRALQEGLQHTNEYIVDTLYASLQGLARSAQDVEAGLQEMLHNLTAVAMQSQSEVHEEYRNAVRSFNQEASSAILSVAAEARASMVEMSKDFAATKSRMADLERSIQDTSALVESQSSRINDNNRNLLVAKKVTNHMNSELKNALASASEVNNSLKMEVWSLSSVTELFRRSAQHDTPKENVTATQNADRLQTHLRRRQS
ncbi:hypothetical protein Micbo1qcDRAFT_226459 [Microdochium bolleyi]|uniref:Nuclear membrane fusion protein Kar5 n=1 Tax=Microdochium bolleyi TaxID=196109 RepID=A0A136IZZ4_9PEZI|nr:hypothetical protein Micbo1qcDRAFT_226459 [Microdochium bolleyi]